MKNDTSMVSRKLRATMERNQDEIMISLLENTLNEYPATVLIA